MNRAFRTVTAGLLVAGMACAPPPSPPTPKEKAKELPADTTATEVPKDVTPKETPKDTPPIFAPPKDLKALADGNNQFAVDLYKRLAQKESGNIFFSPYSVRTALGMTYAGARGQTAEEMAKALHFTLPPEKLHSAFGATAQRLQKQPKKPPEPKAPLTPQQKLFLTTGDPFQLNVANLLCGQRGFSFRPEFLDLTKKNYASDFQQLDFAGDMEGSRGTINRWVAEKTKNKISELLDRDSLDPMTKLVLTNVIYFKASWDTPFDKDETQAAPFEITPGEKVTVAMMQTRTGTFGYLKTDNSEWVDLPYYGQIYGFNQSEFNDNRCSMIVLLPQKGEFNAVEKAITPAVIQEAIGKLEIHMGKVSLPKFQARSKAQLKDDLSHLGMPQAFSTEADFSSMTADSKLMIGSVNHETYVNVDEIGTEAAAVTGLSMSSVSIPPPFSFTADRPFLFFIRDNASGSILFFGRVVRPNKMP